MEQPPWQQIGLVALGSVLSFLAGWRQGSPGIHAASLTAPATAALAPVSLGETDGDPVPGSLQVSARAAAIGGADAPAMVDQVAQPGAGKVDPPPGTPAGETGASAAPGKRPATYTVRDGDTLGTIARRLGVPVEALRLVNDLDDDLIRPGQVLIVPGERPTTHKVRPGDTAWDIASRYGVSLEALAEANSGLEELGFLQVGQILKLPPGASWQPAETPSVHIEPDARYVWPVSGPISSPYGPRWGRFHSGIDIAANSGEPIVAARSGVVDLAGWVRGYGNTVILRHADGSRTLYAHSSQLLVRPGQRIRQGEVVALVGSTGRSTGPHLHFEIIGDRPLDPLRFLPRR